MMRTLLRTGFLFALVLGLGLSFNPVAHASHQTSGTPAGQAEVDIHAFRIVNGVITGINAQQKKVTVRVSNTFYTVQVDNGTRIHQWDDFHKDLVFSSLHVGDRVSVFFRNSTLTTANGIVILRDLSGVGVERVWTGELARIDRDSSTRGRLTFKDGNVFHYSPNTNFVRLHGGDATIDSLQIGDDLRVVGFMNSAGLLVAKSVKDLDLWHSNAEDKNIGEITSINKTNNTMTVRIIGSVDSDDLITVNYSTSTRILMDDDVKSESDLDVGDTVRIGGIARLSGGHITISNVSRITILDN